MSADRRFYDQYGTVTLEQHRALELARPLTDLAIGAHTDGKRSTDALCSALHSAPDLFEVAGRSNPTMPDIPAYDRERARRRRRPTTTPPEDAA